MDLNIESDIQFLARMLINTREGHQISGEDIRRLQNLSQFGPGPVPPTPPEAHRPQNPRLVPPAQTATGAPAR
jgi:hypothetical protein